MTVLSSPKVEACLEGEQYEHKEITLISWQKLLLTISGEGYIITFCYILTIDYQS